MMSWSNSLEIFVYLFFCGWDSCNSQILVMLEANVMTVVGFYIQVSQPLSIKSDQTRPHGHAEAEELKLLIKDLSSVKKKKKFC